MKNFFQKTLFYIFTILAIFLIISSPILAGTKDDIQKQANELSGKAGMNTSANIGSVLQIVISAFLGMMGIVFLVLILVAGYKYMMDGGEGKGIKEAQDSIKRAVIGLIIVVAAYAITQFVFKNLDKVNDGTGAYLTTPITMT